MHVIAFDNKISNQVAFIQKKDISKSLVGFKFSSFGKNGCDQNKGM